MDDAHQFTMAAWQFSKTDEMMSNILEFHVTVMKGRLAKK